MAQTGIQEAAEQRIPSRRTSYFARHWNGELSLPRSYWINGALLFGLACNMVFAMVCIASIFALRNIPVAAFIVGVAEVLLNVVAYVWALVGVWRSAGKYQGPKVWAILARVVIVVGVFVSIANVSATIRALAVVTQNNTPENIEFRR
jgi:hypothetical protein